MLESSLASSADALGDLLGSRFPNLSARFMLLAFCCAVIIKLFDKVGTTVPDLAVGAGRKALGDQVFSRSKFMASSVNSV